MTKAALPIICKALYWEGMSVLYDDIVLRGMDQIFALACTLRSPQGPSIRPLIKSILLESCPIGGKFASIAKEELGFILRECHALRSLSHHPHPNFPLLSDKSQDSNGDSYFNPTWFFHVSASHHKPPFLDGLLASCLHHLDLRFVLTELQLRNLHDLLLAAVSLKSLTLDYTPMSDIIPSKALDNLSIVQLSSLVELYIPFEQEPEFDRYIRRKWNMPKLARLTLVALRWWPRHLLERFGAHLVYLHLFAKSLSDPLFYIHPCLALALYCPMLEHLIIPNPHNFVQHFPSTILHSPMLKHLDIWDFGSCSLFTTRAGYYQWLDPITSIGGRWLESLHSNGVIPSLRTVCCLFTDYGQYRGIDWLTICHPNLLLDRPEDEVWHTFPNVYVVQTATRLIPHPFHSILDNATDESMLETDSDSDWRPSSRESGENMVETNDTDGGTSDADLNTSDWMDLEDVGEGDYL